MRTNFTLSPSQRNDARAALALLAPVGISLEQAARIALGKKAAVEPVLLAKVADEFLRSKLNEGCRPATFDWYEERLNFVTDQFGHRQIDSVTKGEFREWLAQSSAGAAAKAGTARAARALWRYARQKEPPLVNQIVTEGLAFATRGSGEGSKKFLKVEECKRMLAKIEPRHRNAVAVMLFAGVRPEEVAGQGKEWLRWEHVNVAEQLIRIPSEIAKTGTARVMEGLPEALWAFLKPGRAEERVAAATRRTTINAAKEAAGLTVWPQDALRHSFASYAYADSQDSGKVAYWLGHEGKPTMLFRHYRGLVTAAEAKKFWALRP